MDVHLALLPIFFMLYRLHCIRRNMAMRWRRRRLFLFLQCGLLSQTLPTATSTTLTLLNVAHMHLQSMKTEWSWTLCRPRFGWSELMLEDESQSCYWKEHFKMRKDMFLWLVNPVSPEISRRNTRLRKAISPAKRVAIALWRLAGGGSCCEVSTHWCGKVILCHNHQRILPHAEQIFKAFYQIASEPPWHYKSHCTVSRWM